MSVILVHAYIPISDWDLPCTVLSELIRLFQVIELLQNSHVNFNASGNSPYPQYYASRQSASSLRLHFIVSVLLHIMVEALNVAIGPAWIQRIHTPVTRSL